MSFQAMAQVMQLSDVATSPKMILMCLANYAGDDYYCYPSVDTLAKEGGFKSARTVSNHLKALEEGGYIKIKPRFKDGKQLSNGYVLLVANKLAPQNLRGKGEKPPASPCKTGGKICTPAKNAPPQINTGSPANFAGDPVKDPINGSTPVVPTVDSLFESFWCAYPVKKSKQPARKAFNRLAKQNSVDALAVLTGQIVEHVAQRTKLDPQWLRDGGQYIPLPSTFLNQERWFDEFSTGGPYEAHSGSSTGGKQFGANPGGRYAAAQAYLEKEGLAGVAQGGNGAVDQAGPDVYGPVGG